MTDDSTPHFPELSLAPTPPSTSLAAVTQGAGGRIEEQWEMGFMGEVTNPVRPEVSVSMLEAETTKVAERSEAERETEESAVTEIRALATGGESLVKLELFGRPDEDLAQMTRLHLQKMHNNPRFADPVPSQADLNGLLETFVQDCRDTRNAMTHVRMLVAQKLKSRRRLEQALNRRGNYVQLASHGDAEAILSTAFGVRRKRSAAAELDAPSDLQAVPGPHQGSMILTWAKVKNAKQYRLEYGPVDGPFVELPLTGRRRKELQGLQVGVMHRFRLAAIGGATGQSPWSMPVERMVA